jgi:hypothetical protein
VFRITVWVAAAVAVGAAALPTSASADSVKRYEQTGVPRSVVERFALTDDERRALDISSMRVTGAEGFGVMLEVRLHGDFQRRIGRSGLRRGALAVSLHSAASTVTVLTRGEAVRSQRVLRSPAETAAVAVRTGRTVRVFVHTPGFGAVERVEAVSFARGPAAPSDLRGSTQRTRSSCSSTPLRPRRRSPRATSSSTSTTASHARSGAPTSSCSVWSDSQPASRQNFAEQGLRGSVSH